MSKKTPTLVQHDECHVTVASNGYLVETPVLDDELGEAVDDRHVFDSLDALHAWLATFLVRPPLTGGRMH